MAIDLLEHDELLPFFSPTDQRLQLAARLVVDARLRFADGKVAKPWVQDPAPGAGADGDLHKTNVSAMWDRLNYKHYRQNMGKCG